jgi:hypothetical protein
MIDEVSHTAIYERLIAVESKVDKVAQDTKDVVDAFHAAQGAFVVLDWLSKIAKPLLFISGLVAALATVWSNHKV